MIGKNGILNNLKMYNEFLLIDTSLSEGKIIDFVKKNPKCGVISFDFTINEILNQHKIEFESSEKFLKNFDYQKIQDVIYKLSYWSENSSIKEFLVFKNINIGKLFFDEILDYLVKFCKYFFALKSISQNYSTCKFFVSRNLYKTMKIFANDVVLIDSNNARQEFVHDKVKVNMNLPYCNYSTFIDKKKYKKIKNSVDGFSSLFFSPSKVKTNSKRLVLVEFDTLKYKDFLCKSKSFDLDIIFFGIRRPAFWNTESFSSFLKSKCKIINSNTSSQSDSEFAKNVNQMKSKFNSLWDGKELLNSIFQIENIPIWAIVEDDIKTLLESRLEDTIRNIQNTLENFQKYQVDGICVLSEVGFTEQISIEAAKTLAIPVFLIQAGVYWDTKEANKMNKSQGIYPFKSDFHLCFGEPQKNDCVINATIPNSKVIPTGPVRYDQLNNQYSFGFSCVYGSGQTYTPVIGKVHQAGQYGSLENPYSNFGNIFGAKNSSRYPNYFRIDVSIARKMKLFGIDSELKFQIVNLTDYYNVLLYNWDHESSPSKVQAYSMFPRIITFGWEFKL